MGIGHLSISKVITGFENQREAERYAFAMEQRGYKTIVFNPSDTTGLGSSHSHIVAAIEKDEQKEDKFDRLVSFREIPTGSIFMNPNEPSTQYLLCKNYGALSGIRCMANLNNGDLMKISDNMVDAKMWFVLKKGADHD